jgi:hypothetical protein
MKKNSKRKLLFTSIMLAALLISSAYASLIPKVEAAELPIQGKLPVSLPKVNVTKSAIEEKGLPILSNVLGLDLARYEATSKEGPQDLYMDVVPEENVRYTLQSNDSKVELLCTFANGNLRMINVLEREGVPHLTNLATKSLDLGNATLQVIDLVETAKGFLNDYQSYSGKAFYGELASMLNEVEAGKNLTETSGNVKLEVTNSENSKTFRWTYASNGFEAPDKCVALRYKDGFLKYFVDTWNLYKVGSRIVNISEEEAIDIAIERTRTFSWKMGSDNNTVEIKNFTVANAMVWETVFRSSLIADEARNEDVLMLYPMYHVWVSLDKFYPGNVYGFNVYVWADTGEICNINERVSTLDPPADLIATADDYTVEPLGDAVSVDEAKSNSLAFTWLAFPVFAAVMLSAVQLWFLLGRKKNLLKRRSFKVGGVLLCLLISSTVLLFPISAVNAVEPTRRATVWGSESTGAYDPRLGGSWRKTTDEIEWQRWISDRISDYLKNDGYVASNYQGSNGEGSGKYTILDRIWYNERDYSRAVVVDFDHGIGGGGPLGDGPIEENPYEWHFRFEDNYGTINVPPEEYIPGETPALHDHAVYDYEIHQQTGLERTFFAFINTCLSAYINATMTYQGDEWNTAQGIIPGTNRARGMPFAWTHRLVKNRDTYPEFTTALHMSDDGYDDPDGGGFVYLGFPWGAAALNQSIAGSSQEYVYWVQDFFYFALSLDISVNQALDMASQARFGGLDFDETALHDDFDAIWPIWNGTQWNAPPYGNCTLAVYGNGNIHLYEYFVHNVNWYGGYGGYGGYYYVNNPNGIIGGSNDDQYTTLYAEGYDSQAMIIGSLEYYLSNNAKGNIYLYGYSTPGYNSHIYVYVSYDYSNWYYVSDQWITQSSPGLISVGSYSSSFRYIAILVYNDYYTASSFNVDSVLVIPPLPQPTSQNYWVSSINWYGWDGTGNVENPENLVGSSNDGQYATLYAGNPGDTGRIIGNMNANAHGHIELYGYSASGYYSDLYVYVSSDYQNWDLVTYSKTITATSPYWIDCGTHSGNFIYIYILVYDSGCSALLYVDSVRVTP